MPLADLTDYLPQGSHRLSLAQSGQAQHAAINNCTEGALIIGSVADIRRKAKFSLGFNLEALTTRGTGTTRHAANHVNHCAVTPTACRHPLLHGDRFGNAQCGGNTPESKGLPMLHLGSSWLSAELA